MKERKVLDSKLLDVLDRIESKPIESEVWRVTWAVRDPLMGNSGGGRWTPDNGFEAVYTSLKADGASAEAHYHLSRAPVFSSSDMLIHKIEVKLNNVLHLENEQLREIGISDPLASRLDYEKSQQVGDAAYMLDYEGLMIPNVRWDCENLVLFLDRIDINTQLEVLESTAINWPAWREKVSKQVQNN